MDHNNHKLDNHHLKHKLDIDDLVFPDRSSMKERVISTDTEKRSLSIVWCQTLFNLCLLFIASDTVEPRLHWHVFVSLSSKYT